MKQHQPVLPRETIEFLNVNPGWFYVDCTVGMGGHSKAILDTSAPDGFLLGLDRDEEAIRMAANTLVEFKGRVKLEHRDYRMLTTVLEEASLASPHGVLADFGISLLQLTSPERGFSFQSEG